MRVAAVPVVIGHVRDHPAPGKLRLHKPPHQFPPLLRIQLSRQRHADFTRHLGVLPLLGSFA